MVMLHMFRDNSDVIVAHFNHGIRESADTDEKFVRKYAEKYGFKFESKKENLGEDCSEAFARQRRYAFLNNLSEKYKGELFTAHHQDDLIETVVINFVRGTGWRGLTPLADTQIRRPLIQMRKKDIYEYAAKNKLVFRLDATNTSDKYLRNRVRELLAGFDSEKYASLLSLCEAQRLLKDEIDSLVAGLRSENNTYERSWFLMMEDIVGIEILRAGLANVGRSATRPQLLDFLNAIRSYENGKKFNLGKDYLVTIGRDQFSLTEA